MVTSGLSIADRYNRDASAYLRHWAPVLLEPGLALLERIRLAEAERVLEVGAGVGLLLPHIASRLPAGGLVVGVDQAQGMVRLAPRGFPRAVMDATSLAFADESFDVVAMAFMLFHLPDPPAGLREVHRVLRPGGMVALATWAKDPPQAAADQIWTAELDRLGASPADPAPASHEMMDTPQKVTALLGDAGFQHFETTTIWVDDAMDCEEFVARRTSLGLSRQRFISLAPGLRQACLRQARSRLADLRSDDFASREQAILAWARRP